MSNFVRTFKSLPIKTRSLLLLGTTLAIFVALPLAVWTVSNGNFELRRKAAAATTASFNPSSSTPGVGQNFAVALNINSGENKIVGADVVVNFDKTKLQVIDIVPGTYLPNANTTGKILDNVNGQTTLSILLPTGSSEIQGQGNLALITFRPIANGSANVALDQSSLVGATGMDVGLNVLTNYPAININVGGATTAPTATPTLAPTATPTLAPTATPTLAPTASPTAPPVTSQTYRFKFRFAGVTDDRAGGSKVKIKFYRNVNGAITSLITPLVPVTYAGNGLYQVTRTLVSPPAPGSRYAVLIKGEKHLNRKFCLASGQLSQCGSEGSITIPAPTNGVINYDFTGVALVPGDTDPQDGQANSSDYDRVRSVLGKLCSAQSDDDRFRGDLDYSGCVGVKDMFLMRQALNTNDEN